MPFSNKCWRFIQFSLFYPSAEYMWQVALYIMQSGDISNEEIFAETSTDEAAHAVAQWCGHRYMCLCMWEWMFMTRSTNKHLPNKLTQMHNHSLIHFRVKKMFNIESVYYTHNCIFWNHFYKTLTEKYLPESYKYSKSVFTTHRSTNVPHQRACNENGNTSSLSLPLSFS